LCPPAPAQVRRRARRRKEIIVVTEQSAPYGIPEGKGSEVVPGRAGELLGRQCIRCGAVGTHYLTCPGLRLPSGYRLSDAPGPYTTPECAPRPVRGQPRVCA
jgi:hypothetical protein